MADQNVNTSQETAVEKDTKSTLTNRQREFAKLLGPTTTIFSVNAHCLTSRYLNQMFWQDSRVRMLPLKCNDIGVVGLSV